MGPLMQAVQPARLATLDPGEPLVALTATARGMIDRNFIRAAQRAHTELMAALGAAGLIGEVRSHLGLYPDAPDGDNDARCRYVAGVLLGHDLAQGQGRCLQPALALSGTLAWVPISPGRWAVFEHHGPVHELYRTWRAIHAQWLPASGERLRAAPPMELSLASRGAAADEARTEIWIPLA